MQRFFFLILGIIFLVGSPLSIQAAENTTGGWEVMSLGADRSVQIWQKGSQIRALRVLYPTFEGERYKLEHFFKGEINGTAITGTLFVREEGMKEFDNLRAFSGEIKSAQKILVDGLYLKRVSTKPKGKEPQLEKKKRRSRRGGSLSKLDLSGGQADFIRYAWTKNSNLFSTREVI